MGTGNLLLDANQVRLNSLSELLKFPLELRHAVDLRCKVKLEGFVGRSVGCNEALDFGKFVTPVETEFCA